MRFRLIIAVCFRWLMSRNLFQRRVKAFLGFIAFECASGILKSLTIRPA
jgi:hypothetical protein